LDQPLWTEVEVKWQSLLTYCEDMFPEEIRVGQRGQGGRKTESESRVKEIHVEFEKKGNHW
jgi:hypothetical protein